MPLVFIHITYRRLLIPLVHSFYSVYSPSSRKICSWLYFSLRTCPSFPSGSPSLCTRLPVLKDILYWRMFFDEGCSCALVSTAFDRFHNTAPQALSSQLHDGTTIQTHFLFDNNNQRMNTNINFHVLILFRINTRDRITDNLYGPSKL